MVLVFKDCMARKVKVVKVLHLAVVTCNSFEIFLTQKRLLISTRESNSHTVKHSLNKERYTFEGVLPKPS